MQVRSAKAVTHVAMESAARAVWMDRCCAIVGASSRKRIGTIVGHQEIVWVKMQERYAPMAFHVWPANACKDAYLARSFVITSA
jgi:hypothetical protein